jgi:hypothetical protein
MAYEVDSMKKPACTSKRSWEETYKAIAKEQENWKDFDQTLLDGLEENDEDTAQLRRLITEMYGE